MGAYVGASFAMHYPERVNNLILADGGFTLATPAPDVDIKELLDVVLGPSIQRCSMKFASVDDYIGFWKQHPAFQKEGSWNEVLQEFVVYDLMGEAPELHSKIALEAIYADGRDTLLHEDLHIAVDKISCPILLVRAPRGILDQPEGLYSDEVAADLVAKHPNLTDVLIEDVNHWTLVISERGAHEVGELIRPMLPSAG
jgi:lipase